ncbi:MAG: hypothetical protein R3C40_03935 [Parvularculaceae bacterium]|nr:hypothetical protein [Parvularculaceae bacterium]
MNLKFAVFIAAFSAIISGCSDNGGGPTSSSKSGAGDIKTQSPIEKAYSDKDGEQLDVDQLLSLFPGYMQVRYADARFDDKSGATVVSNLEFHAPGDYDGNNGFVAERAELYGVDLDAVERVKAATEAGADAPMEPIFEKVRLFGLRALDEETPSTVKIGAVELDHLRVRRGGIPENDNGASGVAGLFNAFDLAGVYFQDIDVTSAEDADASVKFFAPDLRFVGIGGGKLSALLAKDLDYTIEQSPAAIAEAGRVLGPAGDIFVNGPLRGFIAPEHQRTTIETFAWRNIDFSGLLAYGLRGEEPPITAHDLINLGEIRADNMEAFLGDRRLSVVPESVVSPMEFTWLAPSKFRAYTKGGEYDFTAYLPAEETDALAALKKHGLDKVKGDSEFDYDWNADKGGASLSSKFDTTGFADFNFDVALDGLNLKTIHAAQQAGDNQAVMKLARLKSLAITLDDETMLDAFYELSAIQAGGSPEDVRAATPSLLRFTALELGRNSPKLKSYIEALADFLQDGGRLEIRAAPETPVPLSEIQAVAGQGPDAAANLIALTVTRSE